MEVRNPALSRMEDMFMPRRQKTLSFMILRYSICSAFLFSALFLQSCSPDEKLNGDTNEASIAGGTSSEAVMNIAMTPDIIARGHSEYMNTCSPCHGAGGKGDGPAAAALNPKPRDHTNGAYMDKLSNAHIFKVIRYGGSMFGYPTMPAQPNLSDDDVKALVAYVRTLSSMYKR